jgi:hypothetical protein
VISEAKRIFNKPFFMEVLITACWNIRLVRNGKIFLQERLCLQDGKQSSFMISLSFSIGSRANIRIDSLLGLIPYHRPGVSFL